MSDVSPSSSVVDSILGTTRRDGGGGNSDVPQLQESVQPVIAALITLDDTPARRTAQQRWKKGKKKVLLLVGSPRCLLNGDFHTTTLHLIHIVPRTLWRAHPELFILFQDAIGVWVQGPDGRWRRVLNLDTTANQDILNSVHHGLFDGSSVLKGLGTGIIFLVPVELAECLRILRKGRRALLDYNEMFPLRTYTYLVFVFADSQNVPVTCFGPQQRSYAHLEELLGADAAQFADDITLADDADGVDADNCDDETLAATSQVFGPDDIPNNLKTSSTSLTRREKPHTHYMPDDGPLKVVSHTKPLFWLWDTGNKLRLRVEKKRPLSSAELKLHDTIMPDIGDWYKARTPAQKELVSMHTPDMLFGGGTRMSPRLHGEMMTEPGPKPAPTVKTKARAAQTAAVDTVVHAAPTRTNSRYNLRSLAKAQAASESTEKRSAPSTAAEADQPKRKKKKTGKA
ncbi:hypothetical protein EV122DRAFT_294904 [Schizophyllum commune]